MSRAAGKQAQSTYSNASALGAGSAANANGIFPGLLQSYQSEATNPQGIGPAGLTAENTASQQSTGGSVAGSVGQNNQMAARTRNKGGFQIANDESARSGMRTNSQNAVENIARDEQLKQVQKQEGLAGENSLFGQNMNAELGSLNAENGATAQLTQAGQSGWFQNMLGFLNAVKGAGASSGPGGASSFTV